MKSSKYSIKERIIAIIIVVVVFTSIAFIIRNEGETRLPNGDHIVRITHTGEKYHNASCSYLHSSSIKIPLVDANRRGYGSCSRCNPPEYISEEEYTERKANQSIVLIAILSLLVTGFVWGIIYSIIKELSGDWFIYILFAIAYGIILRTVYIYF